MEGGSCRRASALWWREAAAGEPRPSGGGRQMQESLVPLVERDEMRLKVNAVFVWVPKDSCDYGYGVEILAQRAN